MTASKTINARLKALEHLEKAVRALQRADLWGDAQDLAKAGEPLRRVVKSYYPELLEKAR